MAVLPTPPEPSLPATFYITLLPGSDRKKSARHYQYRLTFRNPDRDAVGCTLICEVQGGRLPYQIAVERDAAGQLRLHCTCADAVFRAENEGRFCKHIQGLLDFGRQTGGSGEPADLPRPNVA